MIYKGYADGFPDDLDVDRLIVDGSRFLGVPGFWAAHYLSQTMEDETFVDGVWGLDRAVVRAVQDELNDPGAWPAFEADLASGGKLVVVYRNFADDAGVDYLLVPDGESEVLRIATTEGEYEGPGISWAELSAVAGGSAEILLLLAPMLGDVEADDDEPIAVLAEALRSAGAVASAEEMARLIVAENLQWEPADWYETDFGATCCDGESSPRNPASAVALTEADLVTVSRLLG
ncbi:hypothetical protein [Actinoplanes solisilvae]|uniref:hypothetical protein n=1 Tax=Actinoplanes solisilvae TaxID=2486853 RepID=UPI000FDBAF74|nr:hypothetical protein [Actinoplanes solisilvae]